IARPTGCVDDRKIELLDDLLGRKNEPRGDVGSGRRHRSTIPPEGLTGRTLSTRCRAVDNADPLCCVVGPTALRPLGVLRAGVAGPFTGLVWAALLEPSQAMRAVEGDAVAARRAGPCERPLGASQQLILPNIGARSVDSDTDRDRDPQRTKPCLH